MFLVAVSNYFNVSFKITNRWNILNSQLLTIKGNRIEVELKDFIIHKQARQASWITVNICTRFNGT